MTLNDMWGWGMPLFSGGGEIALVMLLIGIGIIWVIIWLEDSKRKEVKPIG